MNTAAIEKKPLPVPMDPEKLVDRINRWFAVADQPNSYKRTTFDFLQLSRTDPEGIKFISWAIGAGLIGFHPVPTGRNRRYAIKVYIPGTRKRLPDRINVKRTHFFREIEAGRVQLVKKIKEQ